MRRKAGRPPSAQTVAASGEKRCPPAARFPWPPSQASIVDRFEFLVTPWTNDRAAPLRPSGQDFLVGQNGEAGQEGRDRPPALNAGGDKQTFTAVDQFVIPLAAAISSPPESQLCVRSSAHHLLHLLLDIATGGAIVTQVDDAFAIDVHNHGGA